MLFVESPHEQPGMGENGMLKFLRKRSAPEPAYTSEGIHKGEEAVFDFGYEAGRGGEKVRCIALPGMQRASTPTIVRRFCR